MGITANFNKGSIDQTFRAFLAEVERQIIESLCRVGEEAVKLAKLIPCLLYTSDAADEG